MTQEMHQELQNEMITKEIEDQPTNYLIKQFEETNNTSILTSFENDNTKETKTKLFKALASADKKLKDYVGEELLICDYVLTINQFLDEETGELTTNPTIVLFDENDISYRITSISVYNSLKTIIALNGKPTKQEPIKVKIKSIQGNNNFNFISLEPRF